MVFMAYRLAQAWIGYSKPELLEKMPGTWSGATVEDCGTFVRVRNERYEYFDFCLMFGSGLASSADCLVVRGRNELSDLWLIVQGGLIESYLRPDAGNVPSADARRAANALQRKYGVRSGRSPASPFEGPRDIHPELRDGDRGVLMPSMTMAMVIMALADGPLTQAEKDGLLEVFYAGHRGDLSPREVLTRFQAAVDLTKASIPEHGLDLFETARNLSVESKRQILEACDVIARIDGPITEKEQDTIAQVASWIGLNTS
jgi:tellurite resistance protein